MDQIIPEYSNRMDFTFECEAAASFLVIRCNAEVLKYQVLMLEHNSIRHVLPINVVTKEGIICFYYNITSKISVSFFLNRRKFNREEFLKFLLSLAATVSDSTGYLLTDSNFIFNPEYMYINPETLEPALVYVPISQEPCAEATLQSFIAELVLQHIHVEGFGSGNLVQRILAAAKSEKFYIKGFKALLMELLYGQSSELAASAADDRETVGGEPVGRETIGRESLDRKSLDRETVGKVIVAKKITGKVAVMAQIIMGGAIYFSRGFLNNASNNPTATYAAVIMIVLAVEVLIFKKLTEARLIKIKPENETVRQKNEKREAADRITSIANTKKQINHKRMDSLKEAPLEAEASTGTSKEISKEASVVSPRMGAAGKTELLGGYSKGVRLLKSVGKQNGDGDIVIDKDDYIIGRLECHADHVIRNNAIGKLHAQFLYRDNTSFIKDLNSINGTFINSKRIESNKEYEIKGNDKIQLANSEFVFISG